MSHTPELEVPRQAVSSQEGGSDSVQSAKGEMALQPSNEANVNHENNANTNFLRPNSAIFNSESEEDLASLRSKSRSPRCSTSENLQMLNLRDHYEIARDLGRGTYGKVVQATCKETGTKIALKILPKSSTKLRDFQREFNVSYYLSPHASIVDSYNVAFETRASYVFAMEFAPMGDLFDSIPPQVGMSETDTKTVLKQVSSALEFMHSKKLVHRDVKPENILVMAPDFTRVKLMDFGMTRRDSTMVRKTNGSIPYTPPEICEAVRNESILVTSGADVWAMGVLLFCMLTGNFPWENADIGDVYFKEFILWQRRKTTKIPSQWRKFSPRLMKFFRKTLDIKPSRRSPVKEITKYMTDSWIVRPSDISEHESDSGTEAEQVDHLSIMLRDHGIETKVDKRVRDRRISEWLLSL
ncbi:serine/threonine-protein kinase sbk1 [Plakobranchus ocellatus]|uniref:Serine/threonine-protein kinase sbk1 n=1 Tax=Plakobranchus ocellatus TaxID=259542 RepID=A0AAV4BW40_9GAST|nr:serine/threonine-protein kinase sbk1 [Plakobranchus ocellatus]